MLTHTCKHCGRLFETNRRHAGFCGASCRKAANRVEHGHVAKPPRRLEMPSPMPVVDWIACRPRVFEAMRAAVAEHPELVEAQTADLRRRLKRLKARTAA